MVVDRLLGEHEPLGDLGVAEPLRDEPKYLELTLPYLVLVIAGRQAPDERTPVLLSAVGSGAEGRDRDVLGRGPHKSGW